MIKKYELATTIIPKPEQLIKELRLMVEDPTRKQSYVDLDVIIQMLDHATKRVSVVRTINLMYFDFPAVEADLYMREQMPRSLAEEILKNLDVVSNVTLS